VCSPGKKEKIHDPARYHVPLFPIARCRDLKKYTTLPGTIVSYCSMKESVFFNTTLSQKKKETMRVAGLLLVFK